MRKPIVLAGIGLLALILIVAHLVTANDIILVSEAIAVVLELYLLFTTDNNTTGKK